jgi:DNA repair protein RecO (recombination protein O)
MPLHSALAFVLRTYNFAEADKVCVLLTQRDGKIRGVAHGARKMKSRFGSALEPLTEVQTAYYAKEGRDLVSISSADIVKSQFRAAAGSVEVSSAMSYFADLLVEFLPDHEPNEQVYRLVRVCLDALADRRDPYVVARYFEIWLLKLCGFYPDLFRCSSCGQSVGGEVPIWITREGSPLCSNCNSGRGTTIDPELRAILRSAFSQAPLQFAEQDAASPGLRRLSEVNYSIIRNALERDLRSHGLFHRLRMTNDE